MMISHITALLVCGTWLYVMGHRNAGIVFWVVAAVLYLVSVLAVRSTL